VHGLKSHLEKSHKDLHFAYLSNVGDHNSVLNPAKKGRPKLEESPAKILDQCSKWTGTHRNGVPVREMERHYRSVS